MKNSEKMTLKLTRGDIIRIRTTLLATSFDFDMASKEVTDPEMKERHKRTAEMYRKLRDEIIRQFEEQDEQ